MKGINWCETIIGILVIVFALWNKSFSKIALLVLGVILVLHAFMWQKCKMCGSEEMPKASAKKGKRR